MILSGLIRSENVDILSKSASLLKVSLIIVKFVKMRVCEYEEMSNQFILNSQFLDYIALPITKITDIAMKVGKSWYIMNYHDITA